jgi:hypothetical protein
MRGESLCPIPREGIPKRDGINGEPTIAWLPPNFLPAKNVGSLNFPIGYAGTAAVIRGGPSSKWKKPEESKNE